MHAETHFGVYLGLGGLRGVVQDPRFGAGSEGTDFAEPVQRFRAELLEGKADVIAFRNEIATLAAGLSLDDAEGRSLAERLLGDTKKLAETQAELARAADLYRALGGNADAAATALGGSADKFGDLGAILPGINSSLAETDRLLLSIAGRPQPVAGAPGTIGGSFRGGGSTGNGAIDEIAGFVHGQEYVFDAASTARIGVANLDAIRAGVAGYASGGYVGTAPSQTRSGTSGGFSVVDELVDDFSVLSGVVSQFARDLWQTRDPLHALGSVVQSVSQRFLNSALGAVTQAADNAIGGAITSMIGSAFGGSQLRLGYQAGVGHAGAVIGRAPQMRLVDASLFANAPRHHTGTDALKSGEVPFIGMEGEEIGWPDDLARKYGGGSVVNNWNIQTPSPRAFMESRASLARAAGRLTGQAWRYS